MKFTESTIKFDHKKYLISFDEKGKVILEVVEEDDDEY